MARQVIGYTEETIRIAATLAVNSVARDKVRRLLADMDEHIVYSGQRFDQTQQLAALLNELDTDRYPNDSLPARHRVTV